MTKDERDQQTHDVVLRMMPLIEAHEKAINGNGRRGLLDRVTRIESIACIVTVGGFAVGIIALLTR